jgi:HK97 family phage prohead protease
MEKKTFEFKGTLDDAGVLEGYGAVYGNIDSYGDIIQPASCVNVQDFIAKGCLMVGHNWGDLGVAIIEDAKETPEGLWLRAKYHSDEVSQRARTIATERLAAGKFMGLSIGYQTIESKQDTVDGQSVRRIEKYKVFEVSQVTTPANTLAGATTAKSFEDQYEDALAALEPLIERAKHLKVLREADGRSWPKGENRTRIEALAAQVDELPGLLKAILAHPPQEATEDDIATVHRKMAAIIAASAGIP